MNDILKNNLKLLISNITKKSLKCFKVGNRNLPNPPYFNSSTKSCRFVVILKNRGWHQNIKIN